MATFQQKLHRLALGMQDSIITIFYHLQVYFPVQIKSQYLIRSYSAYSPFHTFILSEAWFYPHMRALLSIQLIFIRHIADHTIHTANWKGSSL